MNTADYSISLSASTFIPSVPVASSSTGPARFHLGEPITVEWKAPSNHSDKDWMGIYRIEANKSKLVTRVSSQGRWIGVDPEGWKENLFVKDLEGVEGKDGGRVTFEGKKLPWAVGRYEIR